MPATEPLNDDLAHWCIIPVKFTLDISGSPFNFNGAPGNIQGNLTGMMYIADTKAQQDKSISPKGVLPSGAPFTNMDYL